MLRSHLLTCILISLVFVETFGVKRDSITRKSPKVKVSDISTDPRFVVDAFQDRADLCLVEKKMQALALSELGQYEKSAVAFKEALNSDKLELKEIRYLHMMILRVAILQGGNSKIDKISTAYEITEDQEEMTNHLEAIKADAFIIKAFYNANFESAKIYQDDILLKGIEKESPFNQFTILLNAARLSHFLDDQERGFKMLQGIDSLLLKNSDSLQIEWALKGQIAYLLGDHSKAAENLIARQEELLSKEKISAYFTTVFYTIRSLLYLKEYGKLEKYASELIEIGSSKDSFFWSNYGRLVLIESYLLQSDFESAKSQIDLLKSIDDDYKLNFGRFQILNTIIDHKNKDAAKKFQSAHAQYQEVLELNEHLWLDQIASELSLLQDEAHLRELTQTFKNASQLRWAFNELNQAAGISSSPKNNASIYLFILALVLLLAGSLFLIFVKKRKESRTPLSEVQTQHIPQDLTQRINILRKRHNNLTKMDLKHARYILEGTLPHQIKEELRVTQDALDKGRYRFKKRLELPPNVTLEQYLLDNF